MSCCGGNKNDNIPGPTNPSLIWPLQRTQYDMEQRSRLCPFCGPMPVPVRENFETCQPEVAPYKVPKYFIGNWGLALNDNDNPLSYTKFKM